MTIPSTTEISEFADRSKSMDRFTRRAKAFYRFAAIFVILGGIFSSIVDFDIIFLMVCLICGIAAYTMTYVVKDIALLHIVNHPTIFYLFTTYTYAFSRGNYSLEGLFDKAASSIVIFTYQISIILAYCIYRLLSSSEDRLPQPRMTGPISTEKTFALLAVFVALYALGEGEYIPGMAAVKYMMITAYLVLWTIIALNYKGGKRAFLIFCISISIIMIISVLVNRRSGMFLVILSWSIFYVYAARQLLTLRLITLAVVGAFTLSVATNAFIQVRTDYQMGLTSDFGLATVEAILDPENLMRSLPFVPKEERVVSFSGRDNINYSAFLADNAVEQELLIASRFVLFPRMDIVTGRLGTSVTPDWDRLWLVVLSALPNVGQEKQLLVADQIIWELGLLPPDVIGRSLVTVPGEFYAIGGFPGLFVSTLFSFLVIFIMLSVIRSQLGYGIEYIICAVIATYDITFTGTSIDTVSFAFKNSILLFIIIFVTRNFIKSRRVTN